MLFVNLFLINFNPLNKNGNFEGKMSKQPSLLFLHSPTPRQTIHFSFEKKWSCNKIHFYKSWLKNYWTGEKKMCLLCLTITFCQIA